MTHFHSAVWVYHHKAKVVRLHATGVEHVIVRGGAGASLLPSEGSPAPPVLIVVDKKERPMRSRFTRHCASLAFVAVAAALLSLPAGPLVAQTYATTGNIFTLVDQVTSRATVDAIDPDRRLGVFILADGHSLMLPIGEGVRNLRAMRHGEELTITYSEVVTVHNLRHASPAARDASRQPDLQSAPDREPEVSTFIVVGIDHAADRVGSVSRVSLVGRQGGEVRTYVFSLHTSPEEMWRIAPGDVLRGVITRLLVTAITASKL